MVTAVEEFGIAAVEAQAAGRPVISVAAGGALETVDRRRDRHLLGAAAPTTLADDGRRLRHRRGRPAEVRRERASASTCEVFKRALPREVDKAYERALEEGRPERPTVPPIALPGRRLARGGLARIP